MVVMRGFTRHVGMFATGQVDPLDGVYLGEQIECPEDRRPSDPESTPSRVGHEIGGGEVRRPSRDQLCDRAPGIGRSIAGVVECGADGQGSGHLGKMIPSLSCERPVAPAEYRRGRDQSPTGIRTGPAQTDPEDRPGPVLWGQA